MPRLEHPNPVASGKPGMQGITSKKPQSRASVDAAQGSTVSLFWGERNVLRNIAPTAMHEASVAAIKPARRRMGYPHGNICTECYRQSTKYIEEGRCVEGWGCGRKRD